jgi:hypothetical protein
MTDRKERGVRGGKTGDWMEEMQGDSETRRILQLWKGRRFLNRLRKLCDRTDSGRTNEGNRR